MDWLIIGILFLFGAIIGSFLNVVILRSGTGMSVAKGRSKCFSCDKPLSWYELVPVFSFLIQGGRCRGCGAKISWQYPLVELLGGLAVSMAFLYTPLTGVYGVDIASFIALSTLLCLYIVIAVYDMRHKIIPDVFSYSAALAALALIGLQYLGTGQIDLYRVITGPVLFLFFYFFWRVSNGTWMGLGDGKLALSVGWMLGLSAGITSILFAFWIGSVAVLSLMIGQRIRGNAALGFKSEIPFGPFILLGFLTAFLFHLDFNSIISFLAV